MKNEWQTFEPSTRVTNVMIRMKWFSLGLSITVLVVYGAIFVYGWEQQYFAQHTTQEVIPATESPLQDDLYEAIVSRLEDSKDWEWKDSYRGTLRLKSAPYMAIHYEDSSGVIYLGGQCLDRYLSSEEMNEIRSKAKTVEMTLKPTEDDVLKNIIAQVRKKPQVAKR